MHVYSEHILIYFILDAASGSSMRPAASASILPNSGATTQMSKVVVGLGLACAAYILQ